ncbi:sensor histidine kinase [Nocardioides sp.]|uniref:sensor histidine kinase n=1 Tax=Nocardioides sp. TaxID=35761 RepID=UPI002ED8084A
MGRARTPAAGILPAREDLLIAGLVGGAGALEIVLGDIADDRLAPLAAMAGITVALGFRRRLPLVVGPVVLVLILVQTAAGVDTAAQSMTLPAIVIAMYTGGRYGDLPAGLGALGASLALVTAAIALDGHGLSDQSFGWLLTGAPWGTGHLVRRHAAAAAASDEEARHIEASARQRVARAADEERSRIARELHDIVSHSLTAMVVQATGAEQLVDVDPDGAKEAMRQVQDTGREAMDEMKHLLGVLRAPGHPPRDPQPALEDLAGLVEASRAAGTDATLLITGTPRPLPRGMGLSVYRIAQEALTNVRKHTEGAAAEVRLRFEPTALLLEVVDSGRRTRALPGAPAAPGYGVTGMRERAALYGGRLHAEPRTDGHGWLVRAEFPLAGS